MNEKERKETIIINKFVQYIDKKTKEDSLDRVLIPILVSNYHKDYHFLSTYLLHFIRTGGLLAVDFWDNKIRAINVGTGIKIDHH